MTYTIQHSTLNITRVLQLLLLHQRKTIVHSHLMAYNIQVLVSCIYILRRLAPTATPASTIPIALDLDDNVHVLLAKVVHCSLADIFKIGPSGCNDVNYAENLLVLSFMSVVVVMVVGVIVIMMGMGMAVTVIMTVPVIMLVGMILMIFTASGVIMAGR